MDTATQSTLLIIAGIGTQLTILIAAVFAGWSAMTAKRIASDTKEETRVQTLKIEAAAKDTAVVLGHVNSEKSLAEGRENTLKRENELLREMLADRKTTAALLAQDAARVQGISARAANGVAHPAITPPPAADTVKQIEENTRNTADAAKETAKAIKKL